jgi:hypothetical protein
MKLGLGLGAVLMLVAGTAYLTLLREPGSLFYSFGALVFVVSPLIGAATAVLKTRTNKILTFVAASGALFGLAVLLFVFTYAAYPEFERTSVQLPAFCGDFGNGAHPPASFVYELPGTGPTTLITSDAQTALLAAIDFEHAPFPSTVYLVQKSDGRILWSMQFANDIISAAIDNGTLYLYNDKLGYWIETRTGWPTNNFFTIDNYGGLSQTDRPVIASGAATGRWYMETTAVISSWHADGSVVSRGHVTFNSIAFNCFVAGMTGSVTQL